MSDLWERLEGAAQAAQEPTVWEELDSELSRQEFRRVLRAYNRLATRAARSAGNDEFVLTA